MKPPDPIPVPTKKKQLGKTKADLRKRARIAAKEVINGAPIVQALQTAGYTQQTAIQHSEEILNNPTIKKTFNQLLDKAGLTDDTIAARINELSNATETKFFSDKGIVTDQREVKALSIQADMVKFAAKVKGHVVERSALASGPVSFLDLTVYNVVVEAKQAQAEAIEAESVDNSRDNTVDNSLHQ